METHLLWHGTNTLAIWWKRNFHPVFVGLIQRHGLLTDCQFPTFSELGDLVYACVACRQPTASADDYWTAAICFVSKYEDFQKTSIQYLGGSQDESTILEEFRTKL